MDLHVMSWGYEAHHEGEPYTLVKYYVEASNKRGNVYRHERQYDTEAEAEALQAVIQASLDAGGKLALEDHWYYTRDMYGSQAYVEDGGEEELIRFEADQDRMHG